MRPFRAVEPELKAPDDDPREGPDLKITLAPPAICLHEHHYTTMCGVTRCLFCDQVVA